jgi:hypothetical protein
MAFANTYLRISTANYEAIPVPQAFIDKRGPVYLPAVGEDDPIEMTPLNAGIKEAYEAKYPNMRLSVNETGATGFEWGVAYEGSTHQVLTLPNLSQGEIKEILAAADALGFDLEPVILAHDEVRAYKTTGNLPAA